jgi:hypothetical protein
LKEPLEKWTCRLNVVVTRRTNVVFWPVGALESPIAPQSDCCIAEAKTNQRIRISIFRADAINGLKKSKPGADNADRAFIGSFSVDAHALCPRQVSD